MTANSVKSPNQSVMPLSARINQQNQLEIGGISATDLVKKFDTPLWIICQETIEQAAAELKEGLANYPAGTSACYAAKAFLCKAMVKLIDKQGFCLDVVSEGELQTALAAGFNPDNIYLHGNNKSDREIALAIEHKIKLVVDNLEDLQKLASHSPAPCQVLLRIIPGIELDTHDHIKTGHDKSKFGIPLCDLDSTIDYIKSQPSIELLGLHAHIGSQAMDLAPFIDVIDVFASLYSDIKQKHGLSLSHLDVGGGLGIAYVESDRPIALVDWARAIAVKVQEAFEQKALALPHLSIEPGRCLVGTAGVTLYQAGRAKHLPDGTNYLSLDGGMADNPRPITYQAIYTARVANRMEPRLDQVKQWSLVGRYCESGDIIVEEANLDVDPGDIIAIFATGAYNYSMASNYNRTARPACVLVYKGQAEVIVERESVSDLLRQDRIASWL